MLGCLNDLFACFGPSRTNLGHFEQLTGPQREPTRSLGPKHRGFDVFTYEYLPPKFWARLDLCTQDTEIGPTWGPPVVVVEVESCCSLLDACLLPEKIHPDPTKVMQP